MPIVMCIRTDVKYIRCTDVKVCKCLKVMYALIKL